MDGLSHCPNSRGAPQIAATDGHCFCAPDTLCVPGVSPPPTPSAPACKRCRFHYRSGLCCRPLRLIERGQHAAVTNIHIACGGDNQVRAAQQILINTSLIASIHASMNCDTTPKPSMQACIAQIGSVSVTCTIIPSCRERAEPLPTSP